MGLRAGAPPRPRPGPPPAGPSSSAAPPPPCIETTSPGPQGPPAPLRPPRSPHYPPQKLLHLVSRTPPSLDPPFAPPPPDHSALNTHTLWGPSLFLKNSCPAFSSPQGLPGTPTSVVSTLRRPTVPLPAGPTISTPVADLQAHLRTGSSVTSPQVSRPGRPQALHSKPQLQGPS